MKKIAGIPLILIGAALLLLSQLIGMEDDGFGSSPPRPRLSTVLIVLPILSSGLAVMGLGVRLVMGDAWWNAQPGGRASSSRRQSLHSSLPNTPSVSPNFEQVPAPVAVQLKTIENSIGMKLAVIPAGKFIMGSNRIELAPFEETQRAVTVLEFSISIYEVTQSQFEVVMGFNPSAFKGPENPVEMVTWDEAVAFCDKLSAFPAEGAAGRAYRLPTEAEWECACRAGSTTTYSFGDDERELGLYAWYLKNSDSTTHPVGQKQPNLWGLYDMHGNVAEWCSDPVEISPNSFGVQPQPEGHRAVRGGPWWYDWRNSNVASRAPLVPTRRYDFLGFRVVMNSSSVDSRETMRCN